LKERFAAQMIPSVFLAMDTLPLTIDGRIDRKALTVMKPNAANSGIALIRRDAPYEEMLCAIWSGLVGVDEVSREDNFFEMRGHWLLATQMMSRVKDAFKVEIPLRNVLEEPTVEGLARRIEATVRGGEKAAAPPLVRASREGQGAVRLPLSFAQQRLWF